MMKKIIKEWGVHLNWASFETENEKKFFFLMLSNYYGLTFLAY